MIDLVIKLPIFTNRRENNYHLIFDNINFMTNIE